MDRCNCLLPRDSEPGPCLLVVLAGLALVAAATRSLGEESGRKHPAAPSTKPTPDLPREDQRLQAMLSVNLVTPKLQDVLDRLSAATSLKITVAEDIPRDRLAFWSLSLHKIPAWMVMDDLRDGVVRDGQWERQADGWRLTGDVLPPIDAENRPEHNGDEDGQRTVILLSIASFTCVVLALLLPRLSRRQGRIPRPDDAGSQMHQK